MLRPSLTTAAVALLGASVLAQGDLKSRLQPRTAPIRHAGVFHVATGTWTRNSTLANVTGPSTIYNNTCNNGYYAGTQTGEKWQHRSRVPTTQALGAPTTASQYYGLPRRDEAPGSASSYVVNGFQFAYCSSRALSLGTLTWQHDFKDTYTFCGAVGGDLVADVGQAFTITGLPPGTVTAAQICWLVDVDLDADTLSFPLTADGDGTYNDIQPPAGATSTENQFGWSWHVVTPGVIGGVGGHGTGAIIGGNYTWTGGALVGTLTPCTGEDGTIWDCTVDLSETGTGMASNDFFRITGTASVSPGCYYFGGIVHGDFYLKLFSAATGGPFKCSPMTQNCLPGQAGVMACPCSNPPAGGGLGCNNFGACTCDPKSGTLEATGVASLAADTVQLQASGENNTSLTVFWTSNAAAPGTGVVRGGGIFCLTTGLKRLYKKSASAGAVAAPTGAEPSVSSAHSTSGHPVSAGQTRHYQCIYRDPAAAVPCGNPASTINTTNGGSILWGA